MDNYNQEYERYQKAKAQVKEIKGFYSHLVVYICVIGVLVFINLRYTPEHIWFYLPMMGWGLGLLIHGLKVFNVNLMSKNWEERKIREFMEEEKRNQQKFK